MDDMHWSIVIRMKTMLRLRAGKKSATRKYPSSYEKVIPWVLGVIALFVVATVVVIALVIFNALPAMN